MQTFLICLNWCFLYTNWHFLTFLMRWNACLRYVYNGDAGTAELHVFIAEG